MMQRMAVHAWLSLSVQKQPSAVARAQRPTKSSLGYRVLGQPGLRGETLSQKMEGEKQRKERKSCKLPTGVGQLLT